MILFRLGLNVKQQKFSFSFTLLDRICPERAIDSKLAADLKRYRFRRIYYTKVVDNFDTFPANVNTLSSNNWSRSNDLWNSGGVAGIFSVLDKSA
jgi:hypothetical protein